MIEVAGGGNLGCDIAIAGRTLRADASGALHCAASDALIFADLHLEKASSFAPAGRFLPPYDTRDTLLRLEDVLRRLSPSIVVALGDSFHDSGALERIASDDLLALHSLQARRRWIWITGNHDPEIPATLGGEVLAEATLGGLKLRHAPRSGPATLEISGHLHPAARVEINRSLVRRPCFVSDGRRLIMPAFGSFTGGLNVLDPAFTPVLGNAPLKVWMLGQNDVYPVATRLLRED
ncbi:MAG: ligase-associated DNA damage response endonuclease PdeM [Rhizobiales bacterium]|nr:ligase-associated DNA damage response endonuclease PdeM [Hyphomicrobiales bacterium]